MDEEDEFVAGGCCDDLARDDLRGDMLERARRVDAAHSELVLSTMMM